MSFTVIEHKDLKFLIFDTPSNKNVHLYIEELKKQNVTHVLRVCDPSYDIDLFTQNGIEIVTMPFEDGNVPPQNVVDIFLNLVDNKHVIGVHCIAGLGRAPVLVAIALIENGFDALDAVEYIRNKRKGSINSKQLLYLQKYKKRNKKCAIM